MNFDQTRKTLLDQWMLGYMNTHFLLGVRIGNEEAAYLLHPQAAKGLCTELKKALDKYEKELGPIDMTGYSMGIPSPLQP